MKFENTSVCNFEGAFRGLRNPKESWDRSDSTYGYTETPLIEDTVVRSIGDMYEFVNIGEKDMDLAQRMIKAGTSDSKFLRQMFISVDMTAPLYFFKEMDTYKVSTVSNSTSTMHKLASTPITMDCFEKDDYTGNLVVYNREPYNEDFTVNNIWEDLIEYCESLRCLYNKTKDKRYWKELIRLLPESWLQTRTWTANYAVLRNIYFQRRYHKLSEWKTFCKWVETLPYAKELIIYEP